MSAVMLRGAVIAGGSAAFLLVVAWALSIDPRLLRDVTADGGFPLFASWAPQSAAGLLGGLLVVSLGSRRELDERVGDALEFHPVDRQLLWLGFCLVACVASMALLHGILGGFGVDAAASTPISLASRVFFFLALPAMAIDRLVTVFRGQGTLLSDIAMKVTERWRWLGVAPALLAIALTAYLLFPFGAHRPPALVVLGLSSIFLVVAVSEEVFFRTMLQTRLELLWGRWAGIITTSLLFALFYAFAQPYTVLIPLPGDTLAHDLGMSLLTYTPVGLLCGYLWACYRNIWVNVLLRTGLLLAAYPPPGW